MGYLFGGPYSLLQVVVVQAIVATPNAGVALCSFKRVCPLICRLLLVDGSGKRERGRRGEEEREREKEREKKKARRRPGDRGRGRKRGRESCCGPRERVRM